LVTNIGIENLRIDLIPSDVNDPFDENHAWSAIAFHEAEDGWVRNLTATGFGYAGVKTRKASRVTVKNVHAIDPVSQIGGGRRYNFVAGNFSNNILFDNCYANEGRHTYAVNGTPSASGIVFLRSISENPFAASEPHRQRSNGILYDNIRDFGTMSSSRRAIGLYNRGDGGSSHGWSAVNSVLWNVDVSRPGNDGVLLLEKPPIGQNYAIGCKGDIQSGFNNEPLGYDEFINASGQLEIESLYEAQLLCRTTAVISDFTASATTIAPGETVTFTENAQGGVTSYSWDFGQDATPATATGAGPHDVTYSSTGQKTVKLTVSNGTDSDEKIKSPFIEVNNNTLSAIDDSETLDQNTSVSTLITTNDNLPTSIPNLALSFDGIDDNVYYDQTDLINNYPFTMMSWFKTTSTNDQTLLYFGNSSSNLTRHSIMVNNGSILAEARVRFGPGNLIEENISYTATLNDGTWYHAAVVHESPTSRKLYIDGVEVASNNNNFDSVTPQLPSSFSAGNRDDRNPDSFFNGEIDDVRLYGSALTNTEINNALQGYECTATERLIKWDFNNQPNTTVEDQFNSFYGTLVGTNSISSSLSIGELKAGIISAPTNGTATFTDDFEITYFPDAGFTGTDQLTYQLQIGDCETSDATVTYTVQAASCPVPTNFELINISSTSVQISWTSVSEATDGYEYIVVSDGSIPDNSSTPDGTIASGSNSINLTGLSSDTDYVFYIRSDCGSEFSDWSAGFSFSPSNIFAIDDEEILAQNSTVATNFLANDIFPTAEDNFALSFDGVDDKISYGTFTTDLVVSDYPFTMAAWYKTTGSDEQYIIYNGRPSSNFLGHGIYINNGNIRLEAVTASGSANRKEIVDNVQTNDGGWHHVAAVFESSSSRSLYVDGVFKGSDTDEANTFGLAPVRFSVGVRDDSTPNGFFNGEIDEVRVYRSVLSASEINDIKSGRDCSTNIKALYYNFNDQSTSVAEDQFTDFDGAISDATSVSSSLSIGELEATIITAPTNGTATFTNDFEITYTPDSNFTGVDQLTYELKFGECEISQATITYSILGNINNWNGSVNTEWTNGNNWSLGTVPTPTESAIIQNVTNQPLIDGSTSVNIENLILNANTNLTVEGILKVTNDIANEGQITFKSTATKTGQFDEFNGNFTGNGTAEVERFIPAGDNLANITGNVGRAFRFLTSTVTTTSTVRDNWQQGGLNFGDANYEDNVGTHITGSQSGLNGFDATSTGNPSMFTFDNGISQDWVALFGTNGSNTLKAGRAYIAIIRGDRSIDLTINDPNATNTTLRANGELLTGQVDYSMKVDAMASTAGNFSFTANPYQAVVNYVDVDRTNLTDQLYVWDASINTRGGYVTVDFSNTSNIFNNIGSSDASNFLAPGQAFFVQNNASGNGALTFN